MTFVTLVSQITLECDYSEALCAIFWANLGEMRRKQLPGGRRTVIHGLFTPRTIRI